MGSGLPFQTLFKQIIYFPRFDIKYQLKPIKGYYTVYS